MAGNSRETFGQPLHNFTPWLEAAVPLFSFGGAFVAILSEWQGILLDFHIPALGCVFASFILAYLAWIRPKKDIVALSTPIYSFIFFIVPTDFSTGVLLQVLYAVSLTLLLVRLKYRFGRPGTAASLGKELGGSLKTYVAETRDALSGTRPEVAHSAALVFVRFAEGNYEDAAQSAKTALFGEKAGDQVSPLVRAFGIIREHSTLLDTSQPRPLTFLTFSEKDSPLLAKPRVHAHDPETEFYTTLDNALLLAFSAAWNVSEPDRPHLLACHVFAQKLLS